MKDVSEDLSVRARRGELDEGAAKQLASLLSGSFEARLAHRAGAEFDAEDSVLPGDEALAARITQRLLVARPVLQPSRRWLKPVLATAVIAALVAAGPLSRREAARAPALGAHASAPASKGAPSSAPRSALNAAPLVSAAALTSAAPLAPTRAASGLSAAPPRAPAAPRARTVAPKPTPPLAERSDDSPGALFARANRARREAQPGRAVALYERLQEQYPGAPEALASEIPLGMLKLQSSEPSAALRHFSAYVERAPQGELGSEALWGQAQALLALGRPDLAQESFRLLLSQYPESAYAGAARAKLQALP